MQTAIQPTTAGGIGGDDPEEERAQIAQARRDPAAFAPIYARYADRVYRYCLRRLGVREAAEDATSQIFAQALAGLPGYRGGSFAAWLIAIAHHVVANAARRPAPRPLDAAGKLPDPAPTPEEVALAADTARSVRALLAMLPADQRRVVELRLAGLTGAEIAVAIGRSPAAVKMLQLRAVKHLRALHAVESSED